MADRFDISTADELLIDHAVAGSKQALEFLIKKHQDWIFNIALNFTGDREEASDIMQEVLIKVITKLSAFKKKSSFRTWLYRIVKNHFLNMRRGKNEMNAPTFEQFGQGLDQIQDETLASYTFEVEEKILVQEAKLSCMKGMLLCLNREQRLIYIIGELFEFTDTIGSEIMEMTKANFRVKLHRAKKQLYDFMQDKCGLVNKNNPCRCARKTVAFVKMGYVDPVNLHFQKGRIDEINRVIGSKLDQYSEDVTAKYRELYQQHLFLESPDKMKSIKNLLSSKEVRQTFDFN